MGKRYNLSISRNYVSDWSAANAIREILQNHLDSPAIFEYDLSGDVIEFTSKGITLAPSTLLLGVSGKRNDPDSVGGKGEGYKLALVVLLREGYSVQIINGNKLWEPAFEYQDNFGEELLVVHERINGEVSYIHNDLTFLISGVDQDLKNQIVDECLYLQKDLGEVFEGERGRVFKGIQGKLFVGGLFVCDLPTHAYSYDFKAKYLPLNRDRKQVDSWCLSENTSALLDEVFPAKEIAKLVDERVKDVQDVSWSGRSRPQEVAEEVYSLFKETHGDDAIITDSYDTQKALEARGIKNVVVQYESTYRQLVEQSVEYKKVKAEIEAKADDPAEVDTRTPVELLKYWRDYSGQDKDFDTLLDIFEKRGVSWDS